jgi:hypothetical protein
MMQTTEMMQTTKALFISASLVVVTAAQAAGTDQPTGPSQLLNITLQPVRVPPNPQGALLLGEATGCYVEFVGKGATEPTFQFRVAPTKRVPTMDKCLASLRSQPGVTAVAPAK